MMSVTMLDIANRLNVSQATVSRVLNGKGGQFISAATRRRVLQAAEELGYAPIRTPSPETGGRVGSIALWIRNPDTPHYGSMIRAVHDWAEGAGYDLLVSGFRDRGGEPAPASRSMSREAWPVDGILAVDCPRRVRAYRLARRRASVPVVCLGSEVVEDVDSVTFDPVPGVEAAAKHLVSLGRKRLAHLTGECSIRRIRTIRADVFCHTVRNAGLTARVITARDESRAAARVALAAAWDEHGPFDGIFCINDDVAIGAYRALRDRGLRIPEDVALIGCDNIADTDFLDPPLTTIDQPIQQLCQIACRMLELRLQRPEMPIQVECIAPTLVVRGSTQLCAHALRPAAAVMHASR